MASLIMARHLESLKHNGWSICFFCGSTSEDDESVIEEVAENRLDNFAYAMNSSTSLAQAISRNVLRSAICWIDDLIALVFMYY